MKKEKLRRKDGSSFSKESNLLDKMYSKTVTSKTLTASGITLIALVISTKCSQSY